MLNVTETIIWFTGDGEGGWGWGWGSGRQGREWGMRVQSWIAWRSEHLWGSVYPNICLSVCLSVSLLSSLHVWQYVKTQNIWPLFFFLRCSFRLEFPAQWKLTGSVNHSFKTVLILQTQLLKTYYYSQILFLPPPLTPPPPPPHSPPPPTCS